MMAGGATAQLLDGGVAMAKGKAIPKNFRPRSPSMPMSTGAAMDKAGMGGGMMVGKRPKRRPFPPPPPAVQSGGTGPGFAAPMGGM